MKTRLVQLPGNCRGVTAIEFALIAPPLLILLLGGFDIAHSLYVRAALQGVVQKVARDGTLEDFSTAAGAEILDDKVRDQVYPLNNKAKLVFSRRYFRTFSDIGKAEAFTDTNKDGSCDKGEPYEDANHNGVWDKDGGNAGQGGAKDRMVYTVTMTYPRMFPAVYFNASDVTTVDATTVLENQPYADQGSYAAPTVEKCK